MEIGYHLPTTQPARDTREALVAFARAAEERGAASLWVSDHVVIPRETAGYPGGRQFPVPPERPYLEPITALAAAAMVTTRARLGASVFILGHRHPVVMAKMLASIDALCGGRLIVGVGVGWWQHELETLGVPFHRRGRQADEFLRAFTELWTKDAPAFEGEFVRFRDIGFMPKPLQAPRPPIWVGGNSPGAFRRVAELGDGWHAMSRSPEQFREELARVREAALRAGRDPAALAISLRFSLGEELLAKGPQAIVDLLAAYKRAGLQHVLVEFRREDHRRMLEILDLVAAKVCPAVEAA